MCHFSSIAQLCLTLCDSRDCSTSGFPVYHQLLELAQTHVPRVSDAIQASSSVIPFSSCLQSFPASESFPVSHFFASGGRSIGAPASNYVFSSVAQLCPTLRPYKTVRTGHGTTDWFQIMCNSH